MTRSSCKYSAKKKPSEAEQKVAGDCPFCSPMILVSQFAQSKHFRAIYNIAPILPGHALVIPKRHLSSVMDLSEAELCEMVVFSRRVARILLRAFDASAFDWTIQEGVEAGQTVPHLHLHLIPRVPNDLPAPGDWYQVLRDAESSAIDGQSRVRLSQEEIREKVAYIQQFAE